MHLYANLYSHGQSGRKLNVPPGRPSREPTVMPFPLLWLTVSMCQVVIDASSIVGRSVLVRRKRIKTLLVARS